MSPIELIHSMSEDDIEAFRDDPLLYAVIRTFRPKEPEVVPHD